MANLCTYCTTPRRPNEKKKNFQSLLKTNPFLPLQQHTTLYSPHTHTLNQRYIMDQLNVKEQQEFQQIVEQKQMKDFMNLYSNLVSRCFEDCVNDFTSNNLTSKETSCIAKCSEKFLKHSERVGQRFQEQKYVFETVMMMFDDVILTYL